MANLYYGNVQVGGTVSFTFPTNDANGASVTATNTSDVRVYKDADLTQTTLGITTSVDFDGVTGVHHVEIDTSSSSSFYTEGSIFHVVIVDWTVASQTVSHTVGTFSLGQIVGVDAAASDNADVVSLVNRALNLLGDSPIVSMAELNPRAESANLIYTQARDYVLAQHNWKDARKLAALVRDNTYDITAASWLANVATISAAGNDIAVGDTVTIADVVSDGAQTTAYNGTYVVTTIDTPTPGTSFTYALSTNPGDGTTFGTVMNPVNPGWKYSGQYALPSDIIRLYGVEDEVQPYEMQGSKFLTDANSVNIEYVYRLTTISDMGPMLREAIAAEVANKLSYRLDTSSKKKSDMITIREKAIADARHIDSAEGSANRLLVTDDWTNGRLGGSRLRQQVIT